MNPYEPPSYDQSEFVDEPAYKQAVELAKRLADGGSVTGSIAMKLRQTGLNDADAERIAAFAVLAAENNDRRIGVAIAAGSAIPFVFGLLLDTGFIPVVITMLGGFGIFVGLLKSFQRTKLTVSVHEPGRIQKM